MRLGNLRVITRENVVSPERGVRKLGHYMAKHTGDLMADWANWLAVIERIADDTKHDAPHPRSDSQSGDRVRA